MVNFAEVVRAFDDKSFTISQDASERCTELANSYSLNAKSVCSEFEAFAMSKNILDDLSVISGSIVEKFADYLSKNADRIEKQAMKAAALKPRGPAASRMASPAAGGLVSSRTPLATRPTSSANLPAAMTPTSAGNKLEAAAGAVPTPNSAFRGRTQSGQVVATLNERLEFEDVAGGQAMDVDGVALQQRCSVRVLGRQLPSDIKYMQDSPENKAEYVNSRIMEISEEVMADGSTQVQPVDVACQESSTYVGRIVCDAEGGRLNEHSLLLEGGVEASGGERVRLDVSQVPGPLRLFPGQVVAVTGVNASGHCLVATDVRTDFHLPQTTTTPRQLAEYARATGPHGLTLMVAAGPLTLTDSLAYEPLEAILNHARQRQPDVLLVVGPLLDADHPLVAAGEAPEFTYEEEVSTKVMGRLARELPGVHVVLQPSTRDVSAAPVYPQPPLPLDSIRNTPSGSVNGGLMSVANPAMLAANEVVLACTSADVLRGLGGQEVQRGGAPGGGGGGERLAALAAQLPAQRSFYPLYPPAPGVPLDSSLSAGLDMRTTPDLLILPSDLSPFAKVVHLQQRQLPAAGSGDAIAGAASTSGGTAACAAASTASAAAASMVVINPGRAAKNTSAGTFAWVQVAPSPVAKRLLAGEPPATNAGVPHCVADRCKVQIIRL